MIIDAHLHADTRPVENFKDMKIAGISSIITLAHDPLEMKKSNVTLEHFNRIVHQEPKRITNEGINVYCAIGIHPRAIPEDYENVLEKLPEYMALDNTIAVGEIGLETTASLEQEVFIKQLKYADENNYNVIVHTPRSNKKEVSKTTIKLLDEYINPKLVQLDHIDFSIIDMVIDKEYTLGITVQPLKMSPESTFEMLEEYGYEKFVLDSDISSAPSNHMSLPETKYLLEKNSVSQENIDKVTYKNVERFYQRTF